ncbi:MAG: UvrD-helicase domain-containing protein [Verrucomicrobiota bacterium]
MKFTEQQQQAIAARGNVLVVAGAGTGKTRTLVERCLELLLTEKPPLAIDQILMVTFTEAAAAEMRQRIRARLEQELATAPRRVDLEQQLALFDAAHIGTLHGFCFKLIRQHFHELELDPQLAVMAEEETRLLADEILDEILQAHYAGDSALAAAVQELIQSQSRGWDQPVRTLVMKLHHYTQTLANPGGWFDDQIRRFESPEPAAWREWFNVAVAEWKQESIAFLQPMSAESPLAGSALKALAQLPGKFSAEEVEALLERVNQIPAECPHGKKKYFHDPMEQVFDEAKFLSSLLPGGAGQDPLTEDWDWSRPHLLALLRLAREFAGKFAESKRELGAVDFHDLEQHTLRLLWDRHTGQPTAVAQEWRRKLRFVFVDEYQDINAAQDQIIAALSGDGPAANRFLVGDVKQSIYRFRLANPRIFQNYAATWRGENGRAIPLTENFRSHEGILQFANSLFGRILRPEAGGLAYDAEAQLRFGAPQERAALGMSANAEPRVELQLRFKDQDAEEPSEPDEEPSGLAELEEANREARLVALRLRELHAARHPVWDEAAKQFRPVEWGDMAVLLRAPGKKADVFAREFSLLGVPLEVARGGFFETQEISDLLSLLKLLDNPLQDVPALAVLHSPLVGLNVEELARLRLAAAKVPFWTAMLRWRDVTRAKRSPEASPAGTLAKVELFLQRHAGWRRLVRQSSLSRCLEAVLTDTHYAEGLLTQPRGEQRHANVQRLLGLAQRFDQFQRQGLFRFLRFIQAQQAAELEPDVASVSAGQAVRLMSIHQSKGLEFPVVVVANLAAKFNRTDLNSAIILDEDLGLCPKIRPPHTGRNYPSLPHWLAARRQKRELLGEELRLLYVAATRARDTLILTASLTRKQFDERWNVSTDGESILKAGSFADWIRIWFAENCAGRTSHPLLRWSEVVDEAVSSTSAATPAEAWRAEDFTADAATWTALRGRLTWQYPFIAASERTAKVSVSALRREAMAADEEAAPMTFPPKRPGRRRSEASAADIGTAHHKFLQLTALNRTGDRRALEAEAERLVAAGELTPEEIAVLDFAALAKFWQSELGRQLAAQPERVRRELPFTARFSLAELSEITGKAVEPGLVGEFVVVQGVADVAVLLDQELWLVDFKTDDITADELTERVRTYRPQLHLYASALSRIYGRPVRGWLYFLALGETVAVFPSAD